MKKYFQIFVLISILHVFIHSEVRLAAIFNNNMVLQQNAPINLWGFASAGEHISIDFNTTKSACVASSEGRWKITLPPMKAGGPYDLIVNGTNTIKLENVLIGEVWICSGQSNMEMQLEKSNSAEEEIASADYPSMRIFIVKHNVALSPQNDCNGKWEICSPKTIGKFSAVGYYLGKNLQKELNVPIGLIQSTWGGTPAEAWMSDEVLKSDDDFLPILKKWDEKMKNYPEALKTYSGNKDALLKEWLIDSADAVRKGMAPPRKPNYPEGPGTRNTPSGLFNGMIYPLVPLSFKGVIWYQGEANAGRAYQYRKLFPALIKNWRDLWNVGEFPFYFVQLPNLFRQPEPSKSGWTELREAQLMTLSVPNTGMAVTIDIGDPANLHPKNKVDVGYRLALIALNKDYRKSEVNYSGPIYRSFETKGNKISIKFDHVNNGLVAKNGTDLIGFTIASKDKKFVAASAQISGDEVIVWNDNIEAPVAVRYAWGDNPDCSLYNRDNLPASPFRTDDWAEVTFNKK